MKPEQFKTIIELCRNATKIVFNGGSLTEIPSSFELSDSLDYNIKNINFSTTSESSFKHMNDDNLERLKALARNNPKLPDNLFENITSHD